MATVAERKKKTVRINGCVASAQAAKYADVDVITAYPIRPYTATMMALAQMVANGELDAEYIVADSEHSQLSIAHGAASSGARVFTGSSGVGVQFAYELYSPISGSRMPVQMMIADRTLDPPGDFGSEHTDALSTRDMGWLMGWSCDAQEAFDNHLLGFRIGEDLRAPVRPLDRGIHDRRRGRRLLHAGRSRRDGAPCDPPHAHARREGRLGA